MEEEEMKFRYVNIKNVAELVPSWAADHFQVAILLEDIFSKFYASRHLDWQVKLDYWIEVYQSGDRLCARLAEPENEQDYSSCGFLNIESDRIRIGLPLNEMMKGSPSLVGSHSLYIHSIETDVPLSYVGITKQRWFSRFAQHTAAANNGSHLIFHRALREHPEKPLSCKVLLTGISYEAAMQLEEDFVDMVGLYPKGLNMIPGGFAGLRYLNTLGVAARSAAERDAAIERIIHQDNIDGRPNPLCAARWAADQDFVNRVICGHSGRLTVDEVRLIRIYSASGRSVKQISEILGRNQRQVTDAVRGNYYARVA